MISLFFALLFAAPAMAGESFVELRGVFYKISAASSLDCEAGCFNDFRTGLRLTRVSRPAHFFQIDGIADQGPPSIRSDLPRVLRVIEDEDSALPLGKASAEDVAASVVRNGRFFGLRSDEGILVTPGHASRTLRSVDLPLWKNHEALFIPLILTPSALRRWITDLTVGSMFPWNSMFNEENHERLWETTPRETMVEICSRLPSPESESTGTHGPIGGVQTGGIGGVDASDAGPCLVQVQRSDRFPVGRVALAVRRERQLTETVVVRNVHHLVRLAEDGGWTFLIEPDDTRLSPVSREALARLRDISSTRVGPPSIRRLAYAAILATAAASSKRFATQLLLESTQVLKASLETEDSLRSSTYQFFGTRLLESLRELSRMRP